MSIAAKILQPMVISIVAGLSACAGNPVQQSEIASQPAVAPTPPQASSSPEKKIPAVVEVQDVAETVAVTETVEVIESVEVTPITDEPVSITDVLKSEKISKQLPSADTVVAEKDSPQIPIKKSNPNHFVMTLVTKDRTHPFYGVGDREGFAVDGIQGAEFILKRGQVYLLEVHSNPRHDAYISTNDMGWGAGIVEQGVEGNFVYDGVIKFTPDSNTPDVVYYQCQNHKAMGGRIFIVDGDDTSSLADLRALHGPLGVANHQKVEQFVTREEVLQKISYANIVTMSKPAKRVAASDNDVAKDLLAQAKQSIAQARSMLDTDAGREGVALSLVDEALRKISAASQMVPSEELVKEQHNRYLELERHVQEQRIAHKRHYDQIVAEKGKPTAIEYDNDKVEELLAKGKALAQDHNYREAIVRMEEADKLVTGAINEMLKSQTRVYKLDIDTPAGEYKYESNRYLGYIELIPVALSEKNPSEAQRKLFEGFVSKGDKMYQQAKEFADKGNFPDAIALVRDAIGQVQRGLRLLGVQQ